MDKQTGSPAFPVIGIGSWGGQTVQHVRHGGMTLRDYFAAHAPVAPDWFVHDPDSPHPRVPAEGAVPDFERYAALKAEKEWKQKQQAAKFFAWRGFYADAMLVEREK